MDNDDDTFTYTYTVTYDDGNDTATYNVQEVKVYENYPTGDLYDSYTKTYNVYDSNSTLVGTLTDALTYTTNGYTSSVNEENYTTGTVSTANVTAAIINGLNIFTIDTDNSNYVVAEESYTYTSSDSSYTETYSVTDTDNTSQNTATYTITVTGNQTNPDIPTTYTVTDSANNVVRTVTDTYFLNSQGNYGIRQFEGSDNKTITISQI
jgi:hypothetical protein